MSNIFNGTIFLDYISDSKVRVVTCTQGALTVDNPTEISISGDVHLNTDGTSNTYIGGTLYIDGEPIYPVVSPTQHMKLLKIIGGSYIFPSLKPGTYTSDTIDSKISSIMSISLTPRIMPSNDSIDIVPISRCQSIYDDNSPLFKIRISVQSSYKHPICINWICMGY